MYVNLDYAEELEMFLAHEFESSVQLPSSPVRDDLDAGYRILDALSCDLALDASVLDFDELN